MTDARFAFVEDVKERSMIKRSASCKKNGSSTSKTLKHELTNKEIEARHGPCKVYNLGRFMSFEEFKDMPKDIQVKYINMLQDKYDVGVLTINREVFGFQDDDNRLKTYLRTQGILKDTYPGTKRKKSGLDQLRNDIQLQKKGFDMPEESVRYVPKFMDYEDFKALENCDKETFVNRLLKEYHIGVSTIESILFEKPNSRRLGMQCKKHNIQIDYVLPFKVGPKEIDVERFKMDVQAWRNSTSEIINVIEPKPKQNVEDAQKEAKVTEEKSALMTETPNNAEEVLKDTPKEIFCEEETESDTTEVIEDQPEDIFRNTMYFSSEYIADEINLDDIANLKNLFRGKKVKVFITVEAI